MALYLMPITGAGTRVDARTAKYNSTLAPFGWTMLDYGHEPVALVYSPTDAATDATLTAFADVVRIPDNLDALLTVGQVTAVQNWLEARNLPALWLDTTFTIRAALRIILGAFQFMQRFTGIHGGTRIFGGAVTLSSTFASLPAGARQDLLDTANSFGYDTSSLSGASTLRQILKVMADQWGNQPIVVGGQAI